jgi:MFS family permease
VTVSSIAPALSAVSRGLGVSPAQASWVFTGYLLASAAFTPILGHLGDAFGRRRFLAATLFLFLAGGLVAAMSDTLLMATAGRAIQGAGGAIIPLCLGLAREYFDRRTRSVVLAAIMATNGLGTGLGLVLGGVLSDLAGYRSVFWLSCAMAATALVGIPLLPNSSREPRVTFDSVGALLLGVGLAAGMLTIAHLDPSAMDGPRAGIAATVAAICLLAYWSRSSRVERPIIDFGLTRSPPIAFTNLGTFFSAAGGFAIFVLVPLAASADEAPASARITSTTIGLSLLPGCLLMMLAGMAYAPLAHRLGPKRPLTISAALIAVGLLAQTSSPLSPMALFGFCYVVLVGIGLHLSAAAGIVVAHTPERHVGESSGVNALFRTVGNAVGAQACAATITLYVSEGAHGWGESLSLAFWVATGFAVIGVVCALFLPAGTSGTRRRASPKA